MNEDPEFPPDPRLVETQRDLRALLARWEQDPPAEGTPTRELLERLRALIASWGDARRA